METETDYTMIVTEQQQSLPELCSLVEAVVAGVVKIQYACYQCSRCDDYSAYLDQCKQLFANILSFASPNLALSTVGHVADNLVRVIDDANDVLFCSLHRPFPGTATTLIVEFDFDQMSVEEGVILESFEDVGPKTKPASVESVQRLLEEKVREEEDGFDSDWCAVDCVICMEEIETWVSSLKMPCSHLFHQDCLLQWLDNSNACPLCRYEMPCED